MSPAQTRSTFDERCAAMRESQEAQRRKSQEEKSAAGKKRQKKRAIETIYADIPDGIRATALSLVKKGCTKCFGGVVLTYNGSKKHICGCVYRAVTRKVLKRYHDIADNPYSFNKCQFERSINGHFVAGYKNLEFSADVCLIAKRSLDAKDYFIFRSHMLDGNLWYNVAGKVGIDRGNFFHSVYRIEEVLGKIFLELKPYPLYPLGRYFHATRVYANQIGRRSSKGGAIYGTDLELRED